MMKTHARLLVMIPVFFGFGFSLQAQVKQQQDSLAHPVSKILFVNAAYQWLNTTHVTILNGGSLDVNYPVSPHVALGLGIQYASAPLHGDNGWTLTRLRFVPVYFNNLFTLGPRHRLRPYFHAEEGISFNAYNKLDPTRSPVAYKVREVGLYLSGNLGGLYTISKRLGLFAEIGYKGFKHSFDEYDVNPHGTTLRGGIRF